MNIRHLARAMPKWMSDLLFALLAIAVMFVVATQVLPRFGIET